jgi:hypothetical protein
MEKTVSNVKAHFFNKRKAHGTRKKERDRLSTRSTERAPAGRRNGETLAGAANKKEARGTKKERVPTRRRSEAKEAGNLRRTKEGEIPTSQKNKEGIPTGRTSGEITGGDPKRATHRLPNRRNPHPPNAHQHNKHREDRRKKRRRRSRPRSSKPQSSGNLVSSSGKVLKLRAKSTVSATRRNLAPLPWRSAQAKSPFRRAARSGSRTS